MADGHPPSRSPRYEASSSQTSSIDHATNSSGSPPSGEPTSMRNRMGKRSVHTRIDTTHVDVAPTSAHNAAARSPKRLVGVRRRVHRDDATRADTGTRQVRLLDGFEVTIAGTTINFAANTQRLIAFLALHERPQPRGSVAGSLWIDHSERRAAANLRTALWKLGAAGHQLVITHGNLISLAGDVAVDFRLVTRQARDLLHRAAGAHPQGSRGEDITLDVEVFAGDLLPDWDEDWILFERERLRQLRMHAIEALSRQLAEAGRYAEAVDAGLAAVAADSLRESAHRVLIEAYLGEGNVADARRQYEQLRTVLWDTLGLAPSSDLAHLVGA